MLNTTESLKLSKSRHGWKVVVAAHFRNTFWMFIWPIGGGLENGWVHSMRLQLDLPTRFLFRLGMDKGAGGLMRMSIRFCPGGGGKSNGLVSRLSGVVSFRLQATVFSNVISLSCWSLSQMAVNTLFKSLLTFGWHHAKWIQLVVIPATTSSPKFGRSCHDPTCGSHCVRSITVWVQRSCKFEHVNKTADWYWW